MGKRWFQWMIAVLVGAAILSLVLGPLMMLIWALGPVLAPVLVGFGLAYAVNPVAVWLREHYRVPRPVTAVAVMVIATLVFLGVLAYLTPKLYGQAESLVSAIPGYVHALSERWGVDFSLWWDWAMGQAKSAVGAQTGASGGAADAAAHTAATTTAQTTTDAAAASSQAADTAAGMDWGAVIRGLLHWMGITLSYVGVVVGVAVYGGFAIGMAAISFFFFLWKFHDVLRWFIPLIPAKRRERVLHIARRMDRAVSAFIRGRLIQAAVVAVLLSLGWWIVGVPYWLLLGIAGGALNLIPFAAALAWPVAVLLAWVDSLQGGAGSASLWWVLIAPSVVYLIAQSVDGWVVEPIVQGQATNLNPFVVMLAVLVGASLFGLVGMLLAIPVTACIKILMDEEVMPWMKKLAADH